MGTCPFPHMFFVLSISPLLSLIRRGSTIAISKNPKHLQADTLKQFNLKFSFTLFNLQFISDFNGIPSNLCSTPLIVPRLISRVFFVLSSSGLRKVQIAYPLVVAVLPDVPEEHRRMLGAQGCIVHEIKSIYPPRTRPSSLWPTTSSTTLSFASRRFIYTPCPHTKEVLCDTLINCLMDWDPNRKVSAMEGWIVALGCVATMEGWIVAQAWRRNCGPSTKD